MTSHWQAVLRVCDGGGGCAGGGVPLGAVPVVLVWGGVSRGYTIIITMLVLQQLELGLKVLCSY